MWRGIFKAATATAAFGLLHSALASHTAKRTASRVLGERNRNGLYRAFFNTQAAATSGLLLAYVFRQPGRELYHVRGPVRLAMHAGQLAALTMITAAAREVGMARMSGVQELAEWAGSGLVSPEPEAQGPAPDGRGGMCDGGPFRLSRHPLNFWGVPILWLWPRMTTNLLAFNVAATVYLALGSRHEEQRLLAAYGEPYAIYLRTGVPFFIPRPRLTARNAGSPRRLNPPSPLGRGAGG